MILKKVMRKRYMPSTYKKDLILQLQRLRKHSTSVEEMYKEMEMFSIKSDLKIVKRQRW